MLFPDEDLFDYALIDLAEAVAGRPASPPEPLSCDRYVARSCLQKAIRRAEPVLAQRALANIYLHDRRSAWRALTIIALEDVGVANVDLLAQTIAAYSNRTWRAQLGGDWPVIAELARLMAESLHCQAVCDLLLRATNDPAEEPARAAALEATAEALAAQLWARDAPPIKRAIAALALGGELSRGQQHRDPAAVLDILAEGARSSHVIATCRAAWRISRNPMSLLLPVVWEQWMLSDQEYYLSDDDLPSVQMLGDVPGYALDQFTRIGNNVSRALVRECAGLRDQLDALDVPSGQRSRTIGDALFLIEGGLLKRRAAWSFAECLRKPDRTLATTASMGKRIRRLAMFVAAARWEIERLRREHFHHHAA